MTTDSAKIPPAAASPVTTVTTSTWDLKCHRFSYQQSQTDPPLIMVD